MKKEFEKRILSIVIILPVSLFLLIQGSIFFILFLSILFLLTSYEWIKMVKKNFLLRILGILFLIFSFYAAYKIRDLTGISYILLIILICIFSDIGGYVFGKLFKGPKLTKISPNKTYAGSIGSFVLAIIASLTYNSYINSNTLIYDFPLEIMGLDTNDELTFIIFVLIISLISQIGDLIISYFKRMVNIKDTGKIIPGHGGLLDRIDGLIFVIPFSYLLIII